METVIRISIIYVFLMLFLRVMGKRELSQMSSFELVTLMIIPEIVSQALTREDYSITNALIGVATLFCLVLLTSIFTHLSPRFAAVAQGKPTVLVHEGKLVERAFHLERVQPEEVFSEMHRIGLETLDQVRWAILEPDGKIAIVPRPGVQHSPRPKDTEPLG